MSDSDSISMEFDFRGDSAPTAMDPFHDDVISDRQQSILNDLRIHLCREDLIYLNNHKEVEAIASLLLSDILKKSPRNPYAHAFDFLSNPQTAILVANFKWPEDMRYDDILKKDRQTYATSAVAMAISGGSVPGESEEQESDEQTEVWEGGETEVVMEEHNLVFAGDREIDVVVDKHVGG